MAQPRSWKKRLVLYSVIALSLFGLTRIYFRATDDFRLGNIMYPMPHRVEWETAALTSVEENKIQDILSQKFHYIGKGAQSYAFVSDDGQFVLKFFKFKHLKPSWIVDLLPNIFFKDYKQNLAIRKHRKLIGVFEGYKVAYEMHKPESGLLFAQLNIDHNPARIATVKDKLGFERKIDLQPIVFVIQQKGLTTRTVMNELLKNGNVAEGKKRIGQILELYASEYHKGIYDRDHGVMHNTGFVGEKPFHLDVGKMTREEKMKNSEEARKDLDIVIAKINLWVKNNYPAYSLQIQQYINEKVQTLF